MIQILCIRKGETLSCLQYVYVLDCVYQKEGNCVMPTVCLCSRLCVSQRGKLYHIYSMFMIQILCIRKTETVSYLQYVYVLDFVYQKAGGHYFPEAMIRQVVSASALTCFNRYIYYYNLQFLNNVMINKTKVLLHHAQMSLADFGWWTISPCG